MKLHRTVSYNPELLNLIPLVTVLFLVLALVTLSNTFVLQPGISVTLPFSSFALGPQHHPQIVSITADACPIVYFHDEKITIQELNRKLSQGTPGERSLIIRADKAVPYDVVSEVMNIGLQRGYSVAIAASNQSR